MSCLNSNIPWIRSLKNEYRHERKHVCPHVCMRRPEGHLDGCLLCFWDKDSRWIQPAHRVTRPPHSSCSPASVWVLGIWTQVFILTWQALNHLSYLQAPCSKNFFFNEREWTLMILTKKQITCNLILLKLFLSNMYFFNFQSTFKSEF